MKSIYSVIFCFFTTLLASQISDLKYSQDQWPTNTVLHYTKSNWDGTNKSFISICFKDENWIESIKWHEGSPQVSVIPAKINHKRFSVDHFINIQCNQDGCNQMGEMIKNQNSNSYIINFGSFKDTINNIPRYWHSYDFDWASLMAAFIFKQGVEDHQFERCDFSMIDGKPGFGPIGTVKMIYEGIKFKDGTPLKTYTIDGPGLHNQGGKIWFSKDQGLMMGFKIKLPDEDSYQDVDVKFLRKEVMDHSEWEAFKESKWKF